MADRPDEFRLIAHLFAPLSKGFAGACGLTDDCAYIGGFVGRDLVVTTDAVVEGVHFKPDTDPGRVAQKALRVNLSDLAAKGAAPFAALLTIALPKAISFEWVQGFAAALKADLEGFGLSLIGGDTVSTPGPLLVSITVFGWGRGIGTAPLRSGAKVGDVIWVSGAIGDAALGLNADQWSKASAQDRSYLQDRYEAPTPRVALGRLVAPLAHAAMDLSDGLVQDAGHIAAASAVGVEIDADRIPLSAAARAVMLGHGLPLSALIAGGDDYEILMTAPPESTAQLVEAARTLSVEFSPIGRIVAGSGVRVIGPDGRDVAVGQGGWRHF